MWACPCLCPAAGAAFGKGIYYSSELPVALAFCQPADGWLPSALGSRLRCLLVCSIDRDHAQGAHNSDMVGEDSVVVWWVCVAVGQSKGGDIWRQLLRSWCSIL